MEPITAEKARDMRYVALKKKREKRLKKVQEYDYFDIVMKDIEKAANDGKNSLDFYPHISDFYDEIIQSGSIVPAAEKDFTNPQKEVFASIEESLGYDVTRNEHYQVTYFRGVDRIDITISKYTIYWQAKMKHTLILMCGVTQSGKSVFAKAIQDSHEDCMTVKRDNCRMYNSEDAETVDKRFYNAVNIALKSHRYVVANDRNINRFERDKFFNNVDYKGCEVICVWVETPQNVAIARNQNRDKYHRLSEEEIADMYKCKVSPQDNEPFDKIVFISEQQNYAIGTSNMRILPIIEQLKAIQLQLNIEVNYDERL